MAEDEDPVERSGEERPRKGIRRRLGRLLNQRELAEDTQHVLGGVLEMSDRAKTEAVRLVAREARNYLDELKIKEDILELITSHSLEVQLSVHLKPLADAVRESEREDRRRASAADREEEGERRGRSKVREEPKPVRRKAQDAPKAAAAKAKPESNPRAADVARDAEEADDPPEHDEDPPEHDEEDAPDPSSDEDEDEEGSDPR